MNRDDYKKINEDAVRSLEINGKTHYMRVGGFLDADIVGIIENKDLKYEVRLIKLLCAVICDKDGKRIFKNDNKEDYDIVKNFPCDLQNELIIYAQDIFFGKKKESEAKTWSSFLSWLKNLVSR